MKKYIWIIIVVLGIVGIGAYLYLNFFNNNSNKLGNENSTYNATKSATNSSESAENTNHSTENNTNYNQNTNSSPSKENNTNSNNSANNENTSASHPTKTIETEIASFTTKIYTKDSERQNNLSIACSTLSDTTLENGKTFSFCDTIGKATSSKGYQKADVFQDGEVVQALGGGMCQVSTTLYNAVLKVSDIEVTERHEHSNNVPYIESGKDAAVAYGSYDFKFVNNTGNTLKIKANNTENNITIKIFKLE